MKKITKIAVIAALCLIVAGAVLVVVALSNENFDISRFNTTAYENKTYEAEVQFSNLNIETVSDDIEIHLAEGKKMYVEYRDSDKLHYEFDYSESDSTMNIVLKDDREWYEHIFIWDFDFNNDGKLKIFLPERVYKQLSCKNVSGDISMDKDPGFGGTVFIETVSGNVDLKTLSAYSLSHKSVSGNVKLDSCSFETQTSFKTVSGDIRMKKVSSPVMVKIETVSGDIDFDELDAGGEINIETVSGDIKGSLVRSESGHSFTAETTSGDIKLPSSQGTVSARFHTVSGDILIDEVGGSGSSQTKTGR